MVKMHAKIVPADGDLASKIVPVHKYSTLILSRDIHIRIQPCRRVAGFRRDRAADVGVSGSFSAGLHLAMLALQNL